MGDGEDVPGWAVDLMRGMGRVEARVARIEGGLALAGFLLIVGIPLLAALHVIH